MGNINKLWLIMIAISAILSCDQTNVDCLPYEGDGTDCDKENTLDCTKGLIPINTKIYKNIYKNCYDNIIWVEVLNNDTLGQDLIVYTTPGPGFGVGRSPYKNIVQVILPDNDLKKLDTLINVEFYFNFRYATKDEYMYLLNDNCKDVYKVHSAPFIIITEYSFEDCNFNDVLP